MVYGVGQANSLMGAGSVSMPVYENGSLKEDQYPCKYKPVDLFVRPQQIELGTYDTSKSAYPLDEYYKENYVADTQHRKAGEITDVEIFGGVVVLLIITGIILYMVSRKHN
jgi:hypothetical protein